MRWDALFDDLEAQAVALERLERSGQVEERARAERSAVGLADRLRPSCGAALRLSCLGGHAIDGVLRRVGPDWLLLVDAGTEWVVELAAVVAVTGLGRLAAPAGSAGPAEARLGLGHLLRGLARDRSPVRLYLADGSISAATLDRVGRDYLEAALHPAGEARRRGAVRQVQVVPFSAVVALRREAITDPDTWA